VNQTQNIVDNLGGVCLYGIWADFDGSVFMQGRRRPFLVGQTKMKRPTVALPVGTGRTLQAPTKTIHGGVTGQKMQPVTRGAGKPADGKSGNGNSK
jgi:hypothetical protein